MQKSSMNMTMPSMSTMSAIAKRMTGAGSDSKFFTTTKKGETHELREELNHQSRDKKKDAVKKVIANMTVGKDVSMLFTDVINCIQTADTQLKKLVYLYLINYAKSNPDLAILAVNTFVKDANDPNPLIRALSIRTMGCIRVERIAEYLCEPLRRCLQDDDPYVRKTAALCVAKLYDICASLVEEQGFLDQLQDLLSDSNPTVVANAVAALAEISDNNPNIFKINKTILQKLLAALNECTEWGQIFILDSLANYEANDEKEAESIIERVTPRLQHVNSAVVLSAVKVTMRFLELITNMDTVRAITRKLSPPLITLLSTEPEIQYVALRNINLIVQKRPQILSNEIKVFFCKYNDPIYVKMEKLEIIIRLVNEKNIEQVLLELKEYATEVDVDFVRKSVRAIGRCAIKDNNINDTENNSNFADKCISVLLELINTKINYIVQEAIIIIKDIFRKYPNQYENIIATLCENLDTLDEPEAKASMIWIIGEYAERIDNADELLNLFIASFDDEPPTVQLQLLTATVKLFLKKPQQTQEMVQKVLNMATEDSYNPDLRDRGYVYWRLLSVNPEAAKRVVLSSKPIISDDSYLLENSLLSSLVNNIATLSSVYHKLPESFIIKSSNNIINNSNNPSNITNDNDNDNDNDDILSDALPNSITETNTNINNNKNNNNGAVDLLDIGNLNVSEPIMDIFSPTNHIKSNNQIIKKNYPLLINQKGVLFYGQLLKNNNTILLDLEIENDKNNASDINNFAIQFNKNYFGLIGSQNILNIYLKPSEKGTISLPMIIDPSFINNNNNTQINIIQIAVKHMITNDVIYFNITINFLLLLDENGLMDKTDFVTKWKTVHETKELYFNISINTTNYNNIDQINDKLKNKNIYQIAKRNITNDMIVIYYSFQILNKIMILMELTIDNNNKNTIKICLKSEQNELLSYIKQELENLLQ